MIPNLTSMNQARKLNELFYYTRIVNNLSISIYTIFEKKKVIASTFVKAARTETEGFLSYSSSSTPASSAIPA